MSNLTDDSKNAAYWAGEAARLEKRAEQAEKALATVTEELRSQASNHIRLAQDKQQAEKALAEAREELQWEKERIIWYREELEREKQKPPTFLSLKKDLAAQAALIAELRKVVQALASCDPVYGPIRVAEERKDPFNFDEKPVYTSRRFCGLCGRKSAHQGENVNHTLTCPWIPAKNIIKATPATASAQVEQRIREAKAEAFEELANTPNDRINPYRMTKEFRAWLIDKAQALRAQENP